MSLISGLLTLPFWTASKIYKQTKLEFPLPVRASFGFPQIIHKNDPRYAEALKNLPSAHIKASMQPFLRKVGVREDLIFVEDAFFGLFGFGSAIGANMLTESDAVVVIAPGFYEADKDACSFTMKHEISHIKHSDVFIRYLASCICQLAASIFGMCFLSFLPALGLAFTVGAASLWLISRWQEARADDFAIANSSDEELKGGRRFLIATQEMTIESRTTFWRQVRVSPRGDHRLAAHPSFASRIRKIEKVLRNRGVEIDPAREREKLDAGLKSYVSNQMREIERHTKQIELHTLETKAS